MQKDNSKEGEEERKLEWRDYVAIIIAMLTTTLLPIIVIILFLVIVVIILTNMMNWRLILSVTLLKLLNGSF